MKRLLVAVVAAVAFSTAFARVDKTELFEDISYTNVFVAAGQDEDSSAIVSYDSDKPAFTQPYPCTDNFGDAYLSLDTGSDALWCTNTAVGNVYFDMVMQFNPSKTAPDVGDDTKIAVYMNSDSNLVVVAGDGSAGRVKAEQEFAVAELEPGEWARLTICAVNNAGSLVFNVYINGAKIGGDFQCLTDDTTVMQFGLSGSGAIDDFVVRTTNPFLQNPAVTIGGEGYASLADALADNPTATPQLEADASLATPLAYGESISVKLNNHTLSGITTGSLIALESTSGDVTTYTAGYFPRTATAGQDGSAANPYELADADDLQALKDAFADDDTFRAMNYKLVADIDAASLDYWAGIGTQDAAGSGLNGGTLDGAGHTIGNLKFSAGKYRGFFNRADNATIKDLTINVTDIEETSAAEHGYAAFVGNMKTSKILNCRATGTLGTVAKPTMHTTAGFAVKVDSAGVFVNCTNEIDIVCSLTDNPKVGGIVGLMQGGSLTNCWNSGDITITCKNCKDAANGAGGLVGYSQTSALTIYGGGNEGTIQSTDTTADGGVNAIKVGTIIAMQNNSTATVTGGVVAQADAAPAGAFANITGLTYATVDNNVATFVPDAELAAGNTYVLQQDVAEGTVYTFDAAGTISFNTNGYNFAGTVAAVSTLGVVGPSVSGSVLSYSAGVAAVDDVAYATFADALAALATSSDTYVTLLADASTSFSEVGSIAVRLDGHTLTVDYGNFAGSDSFDASTGITTYTAAAVVATVGSDKFATLQAAIDAAVAGATKTVNLVGAATGAVTIPEGITVQLSTGYSLAGVTTLAGSGVLKMPWGESPQPTIQLLCQQSTWEGTLYIHGVDINSAINLTLLGNANSTVCFNSAGCAFTTGSTTAHAIKALEVGPNGFDIIGNYASGTFTFPCALTGTGNLKIAVKNSDGTTQKVVKFTGDVSGFTGSINFDSNANCAVYFGESAGNGNCISVAADKSVTVAAGKTWTAPAGFVVQGNMTVNGTLDGGNKLYGTGTITFLVVANTWTGTYIANFKADNNAIFYIPVNASATTVINGVNGEFGGYPNYNGDAPNVAGPVTLNANWTIANGWYGPDHTTTFAKLSGSGDLTVAGTWSGDNPIYYTITELDGYTGTLGGRRGAFTIGKVNVAEQPTDGARVVKMAIGANGLMLSDDVPLYVAGVDSGATLKYDASGAQGAGLYYFAPVVPVARIEGGDSYPTLGAAVAAAADGDVITLLDDLELDARVEPNLGANTTLAFNLGGFTLSRVGTSGNGSVIDVKSGNVVITNGVIDCTQDDAAIVDDGVYALTVRSGSTLTLDDIEITVDSQAGACVYPFAGATVTINGGTYRNNTAEEYQYKTGWTGMAVNQANVATQLITIYGGRFWQVDPKDGDDSGLCTSFLASGKTTTLVAGYWTVGDAATPVEPGQKDSTKYDTAEAATNAAASVTIAVPDAVASALSSEQQNTYKGMFEKKVVDNGDGTFSVAVEMKDEVVAEVQEDVDDAKVDTLTEVLKVSAGASTDVTVATKPGLYYAIVVGNSLPLAAPTSSDYVMATADSTAVSVTRPSTGNAFFKVYCSETK